MRKFLYNLSVFLAAEAGCYSVGWLVACIYHATFFNPLATPLGAALAQLCAIFAILGAVLAQDDPDG